MGDARSLDYTSTGGFGLLGAPLCWGSVQLGVYRAYVGFRV